MRLARDDLGSGPPILLVHGFPANRRLWSRVGPLLVARGFRVVAPDLLGYGESPDAPEVGMCAQAACLRELLDELGVARATIVAHDVGTAAAQVLAVTAPARVERLVLIDGVHETEWAMAPVESIRAWDPADADRLVPVLARKLKSIRDLFMDAKGSRLIHAARCLDPSETRGMTARLRASGVPVRVVWGSADAYLPFERVGRPLAAELGVEPIVLAGGHFLPLDNPEALADAIAA